ncbi:hypothetical protein [Mesorhizobium sp.]|uniref:hypothetical protein n=1 Tax=Mesorhizobium sp. TaxID=1871066 RepID=UPI0025FE692E|nr:hypothetical protein [Mesorhizobium sp.]
MRGFNNRTDDLPGELAKSALAFADLAVFHDDLDEIDARPGQIFDHPDCVHG